MPWQWYPRLAYDAAANVLFRPQIVYVAESAKWAIRAIGDILTDHITRKQKISMRVSTSSWGARAKLIHYGSLPTLLGLRQGFLKPRGMKAMATIWHIEDNPSLKKQLPTLTAQTHIIHTASEGTKRDLEAVGIPQEKIRVVPIGVDLNVFTPVSLSEKKRLRHHYGIPSDRFVIGSFQKDGVGWGEGQEPKLAKGPDILVNTLIELAKTLPVFVFLAGPSRGYVKKHLDQVGIPYYAAGYTADYCHVSPYYQMLDLYLITSRLEGGPLQFFEAWASGVPVVTTNVGVIPDVSDHTTNALVAKSLDPKLLASYAVQVLTLPDVRKTLTTQALKAVKQYDWSMIAQRYYEELYEPLL